MTILLVQPAVNFERTYPLGLAYLAGHLRRQGHRVIGFDARLDSEQTYGRLLGRADLQWIGVSLYSTNLEAGLNLARLGRRLRPDARIVFGGPHATLAPESLTGEKCWDYLVRGDGELPLGRLMKGETVGAGVVCRGQGQGQDNTIYIHQDLDELEPADREVFPLQRYYGDILKAERRWTAMVTTRGCARDCGYCVAARLSRGRHRRRSVDSVVDEMARLYRDHGLHGVYLEDDNLLADPRWATRLFETLATKNPGLEIELPNGVDPMQLDQQMLRLMGAAGVTALSLGIESTVEENQRFLRRTTDRDHLERVLAQARTRGIRTTGYFIIGLPHDTTPGLLRMFAEVKRSGLDLAHVSLWEPPPGFEESHQGELHRALKAAFYLYFYADPARIRSVARQGAGMLKMGRRYVQWLLR